MKKTTITILLISLMLTILGGCKKDTEVFMYPYSLHVVSHQTNYTVWVHNVEATADYPVSYFFNPEWLPLSTTEVTFLNDSQLVYNGYDKVIYSFRNDSLFIWRGVIHNMAFPSPPLVSVLFAIGNRFSLDITYANIAGHWYDSTSWHNDIVSLGWKTTRESWKKGYPDPSAVFDTLAIYNYTGHFQ